VNIRLTAISGQIWTLGFPTGSLLLSDRVTEAPVLRRRLASRSLGPAREGSAPRRRRWLYGALGVIALASAVAVPVVPAAADTGAITFNSVSGNGSGNLTVTVTSDDPLASITVHLWSGAPDTGTAALSRSDFTEQGTFSAGIQQTWVLNAPATDLAALPAGTYAATADATDLDGDQTTITDQPLAGTFNFQVVPSISLTQATVPSTAPNQDINITGQLNAVQPLDTTAAGWGGQPVAITDSSNTKWTGTTLSDGSFSIQVTGTPGDQYTASVAATGANLAATSPTSTTDVPQYATTSITATATPAPYGQQTISGALTYQSGLNQATAPGGVTITATSPGQQNIVTTTGANGNFSMLLPAVAGTTTWTLSSQNNDLATNPFLAGTQESISAMQTWPSAISGFSATLNRYYTLTVGGCLSTSTQPPPPADYPMIQIQYELTTAGPWRELGTVSTTTMPGCKGAEFRAQGTALAASAYYRAYFPGDGTYTSATGASMKAALIATRFSSFTASPKSVAAGKNLKISGTLQYHTNKWHGYAHQRVLLIFAKRKDAKRYFSFKWLTTGKNGTFSHTFAYNLGTMWWSANYNGNSKHLIAGAHPIHVTMYGRAVRRVAAMQSPAQLTTAWSETMHGKGGWQSFGFPFLMAAEPLLILMGRQA
jgi:hypothetical protein